MNKFEHICNLDHQLSLPGGQIKGVCAEGTEPGPGLVQGPCVVRSNEGNGHMGPPEQNDRPVKILPSCNFVS